MDNIIMPIPEKDLNDLISSILDGNNVIALFYNQGIYHEDYIPNVLANKGWVPDEHKRYKVWWHSTNPTNPSDPFDFGHNILDYIEEIPKEYLEREMMVKEIRGELIKLPTSRLRKILEELKHERVRNI